MLLRDSPRVKQLLEKYGVSSFSEVVLGGLPIPTELFPDFPLTNTEVAHVDFEKICPIYPTPAEIEQLVTQCPEDNSAIIESLRSMSTPSSSCDGPSDADDSHSSSVCTLPSRS